MFINSEVLAEVEESDRPGEMEKEQTDSEKKREDPPLTSGPSGPPGISTLTSTLGLFQCYLL